MHWLMNNIGAALVSKISDAFNGIAADGAVDNVEQVGAIIDLSTLGNPQSCKLVVALEATLAATKVAKVAFDVDHGDNSALSDAAVFNAGQTTTTLLTGGSGGTTEQDEVELDLDLSGAKRYLRASVTVDCDASGTDTFRCGVVWVFGGFRALPATASI